MTLLPQPPIRRCLVITPEAESTQLLRQSLERFGYLPVLVGGFSEAVALCEKNAETIACILIDSAIESGNQLLAFLQNLGEDVTKQVFPVSLKIERNLEQTLFQLMNSSRSSD